MITSQSSETLLGKNPIVFAPPKHSRELTKVLHLINGEHFSGAERVQDLLANALPEKGYEVAFACIKPDKFPQVRSSTGDLYALPMRSRFDLAIVGRIVDLIRKDQFQILHAHTPRSLLIARLVKRHVDCPLVYHVHSPVGRDSNRGWANRVNTWLEGWSLKQVDQMICVSHSLAKYMQELGHCSDKLTVVSNGVAVVDDLPDRTLPTTPWTLGTMALFRPRKGTEVLLEALQILKQQQLPVKLRAVGPFETVAYEKEVKALAERLDVAPMIEWTGFQTDINRQLHQMDLFILPSLYGEGLPMVVLEAMANGVPVVASRVEGIPEAVRDGQDGLIFEPANARDLAEKIGSLIGDHQRWTEMRDNAIERQRLQLSDRSMAAGVAAAYDRLLGKVQRC